MADRVLLFNQGDPVSIDGEVETLVTEVRVGVGYEFYTVSWWAGEVSHSGTFDPWRIARREVREKVPPVGGAS